MTRQLADLAARLAQGINQLNEHIGRGVAWLVLLMVLIIVYDVSMRKWLGISSVALQELQWHLFALVFLLSAAYTFKHDAHVRVDVIYQSHWMTPIHRAWVNLIGSLVFLIPFCGVVIIHAIPYAQSAFVSGEGSPDPGGLPYRFILKGAISVGFTLLMLQGIAVILHSLLVITGQQVDPPQQPQGEQRLDELTS